MTFVYRDCGCRAKWSGDELTVHPCDVHALEWTPPGDGLSTFGPPTFRDPLNLSVPKRVLHGDN